MPPEVFCLSHMAGKVPEDRSDIRKGGTKRECEHTWLFEGLGCDVVGGSTLVLGLASRVLP
jgi:hypothetical protein